MLLLGHMGYTVGAAWAFQTTTRRETSADYRLVALMAIAPDIVDRAIFVLFLPAAQDGRLVAHTLLFQLAFVLMIFLARRRWWFYGAASGFHLVLDSTKFYGGWATQLLWPLMGSGWSAVNIQPNTGDLTTAYHVWVWQRIQEASQPYGTDEWWVWLLEIGGALVLMAFAYRNILYHPARLRKFLLSGNLGRAE